MKICFFSNDGSIKELAESIEGVEVSVFKSIKNIKNYVESHSDDRILLFLDLDEGEEAHQINREFLNDEQAIRILITEKIPFKKLKKHQQGKESAFGYIKKPLTAELVSELVNDFELSDYVSQNDLTHQGDKIVVQDIELTFVGIKKPNLDEIVIEEEEEDGVKIGMTQGSINEFRVDLPEVEKTEVISSEEEALLSERGVIVEGSISFVSPNNDKIQEKFDKVFGEKNEQSKGEGQSEMSINLDENIETDPANLIIRIDNEVEEVEGIELDEISLSSVSINEDEVEVLSNDGSQISQMEENIEWPKNGHIEDGYIYTGGDPSDVKNWEEVKK